jgi:hypothetical protein
MPEAPATEVVIADLDDQFWPEWLPGNGPLRRPTAWAAGFIAGESGSCDQFFELRRECFFLAAFQRGGESDMIQQPRSSYRPSNREPTMFLPSL